MKCHLIHCEKQEKHFKNVVCSRSNFKFLASEPLKYVCAKSKLHPMSLGIFITKNTPIQIYRKFHLQKLKIFQIKNSIFRISAQNIDCGYS